MQLEHNYSDGSQMQRQSISRITVQAPGYVSTTSWNCNAAPEGAPGPAHKGRVVNPPPSWFVGLHRMSLEAFWQD